MKFFRSIVASLCLAASPFVGAAHLVVGQVAPLTGIEAPQGRAYAAGMRLYFSALNKAGGVAGHTLELVSLDDAGRPEQTVAASRELLAVHRPLVLAGFFGSDNLAALAASGELERHRVALLGYRQTSLQQPSGAVFSVRATLEQELEKFARHLATVGIRRLAVFHEEGPGGEQVGAAVRRVAADHGAAVLATASYPRGGTQVRQAVQTLGKADPQAVIIAASGAAAAAFIEQYRTSGGTAQVFATSSVDIEQLSRRLGEEHMQGVAIAQVTPNPYKVANRLTKEFNDLLASSPQSGDPVSYAMMEGFINARLIAEVVRRLGPQPTREAFVKALERTDHLDLGGYVVGYGPGKRVGSRWVDLTIVTSAGRIRQ
jgi:ABC-type branched-subunit amino acid transport system substrate-binding protein